MSNDAPTERGVDIYTLVDDRINGDDYASICFSLEL